MADSSGPATTTHPILETKLYIPRRRPGSVSRPRLIRRLQHGAERTLTLISAPAGSGKSTLLAEWLADVPAGERAAAWVSLDQTDNDPATFWSYVVAALQTVRPGVGEHIRALLSLPQAPPIKSMLTTLINELSALEDDVLLILDDFHVIDASPVRDAVAFLLDHLPPRLHLVIATRADPPLPLARLRARGELIELRAADLRFTPDEAAAFLNEAMALNLSAPQVAALETRTEGWIAALQLAALSMRGRDDVPGFIEAFAGDDRYIVDYLVEEVLQRQPERDRSFLLQTSILDRLNGPLCDAVTGEEGGRGTLVRLERGNLFVVPLDDRRHWYRYHHLFADVLRVHLLEESPDQVAQFHGRASVWFEHHGHRAEAVHHALAGMAFERAACLVELAVPAMRRSRHGATVLGWIEALPDELIRRRPVLSVAYAWALTGSGALEAAEARLRDAERWLDATADPRDQAPAPATAMVVVDDEEFRRLPGTIALYRAAHAQAMGDVTGAVHYTRRVLDLVPADDHLRRGGAAAFLGLASWASGDLEAAHRSYAEGMVSLQRAGHISDAIGGVLALADILIAQGRLREARRAYERALQLAAEQGAPELRGTADMYVGLSRLHRERNDLLAATQLLLRSKEQGEHTGFPQNPYRWCVAMARIREAQGDPDGALNLLQEGERLYVSDFFPNVRPIPALMARVWVAQGRLGDALGWAREHGLSVEDDLSYLREFEHITLARVLLARSRGEGANRSTQEAAGLLERLLHAADAGERTGSTIEILVLQALAHQLRGDIPAALGPLERALTLAEPEGYVRIFVDESPPMAALLEAAAKRRIAPDYARQLLTAFGTAAAGTPAKQALIEPLSERELDVLRLLGTDLDGPEIARELVVSLNTMRTHTKNIYSKLGVNSRRAAVRRAEELGLFSRSRKH